MMIPALTPGWTVLANVVRERRFGPLGLERRHGSKHFAGGAKVYVIDEFGGMCQNVVVVGRHRGSNRYVKMVLPVAYLERFRPRVLYSPTVTKMVADHLGDRDRPSHREAADTRAATYAQWKEGESAVPFVHTVRIEAIRPNGLTYVVSSDPSIDWTCEIPTTFLYDDLCALGATFMLRRGPEGDVTIERVG
jgi:hypothetical protein